MNPPFPAIPAETLRRAAGDAAYARGVVYHGKGLVDLLSTSPHRALATVRGTQVYRVELTQHDGQVAGACECPAFEDTWFCKHMVATALAAGEAPATDRFVALRTHLLAQPASGLVDRILRLAERDRRLRDELEREAADATDDDVTLAVRYRRMIDEATDTEGGIDEWGADAYAEEIATVLAPLEALAAAGRATVALDLVEHLLERIGEDAEQADDAEGEVFAIGERACALHLTLCGQVGPDPVALAERLFDWTMGSTSDLFSDPDQAYAEVLGETGLAEFHRLARAAWQALPPPKRHVYDGRRSTLRSLLDRAAGSDVEARIALRTPALTDPGTYGEIAEILLEAGRADEALRWIEDGLWAFEGEPVPRLQERAAALMRDLGRTADAAKLLWQMFERQPALEIFRQLAELPQETPPAARAKALLRDRATGSARKGPYINEAAATLFDVQRFLGEIDEAWTTVTTWGVGETRLGLLAELSIASHPHEATVAFGHLAESRVADGGAANYDAAVRLIHRRGEACADPADQAAFVATMRLRHKAKRTFIQRLQSLG